MAVKHLYSVPEVDHFLLTVDVWSIFLMALAFLGTCNALQADCCECQLRHRTCLKLVTLCCSKLKVQHHHTISKMKLRSTTPTALS